MVPCHAQETLRAAVRRDSCPRLPLSNYRQLIQSGLCSASWNIGSVTTEQQTQRYTVLLTLLHYLAPHFQRSFGKQGLD